MKLQLHAEDLRVESFETQGAANARGTVHGHNTLEGYECMYTHNAGAVECWSYANPCEASRVPTNCTDSQPTHYVCDSCRDSITACGP
ncbi:MAG TPA: hypothetical protein VFY65_19635 [Longimicrobium sp.]|nr:hypothetical protein [Longimicrobium sp.]